MRLALVVVRVDAAEYARSRQVMIYCLHRLNQPIETRSIRPHQLILKTEFLADLRARVHTFVFGLLKQSLADHVVDLALRPRLITP
jgi:hypothetical protein